jgi:hypothetical protein
LKEVFCDICTIQVEGLGFPEKPVNLGNYKIKKFEPDWNYITMAKGKVLTPKIFR